MVDLKEWDNEEEKRMEEVDYPLLDRVKRREEISLLDFTPEYREILRGRTYGLWIPPGNVQAMLLKPLSNLASMLNKRVPVPSVLLVPLNVCRSKAEFIAEYGLVPDIGPSYDIFLQEIREGRILPFIMGSPTRYKGDFYQEILKACEEGVQQLPPFLPYRIAPFMELFSLRESAIQEGIPLEEGWIDLVLQKHPEYDIESWVKKARSILSDERMKIIQKKHPMWDKEYVGSGIATYAYKLSVFGFSDLANLFLELFRESPLDGFDVLDAYYIYLVSGYSEGLGGLRMYDRFDLEIMTFLRIIKNMPKRDLLREGEFVIVSPAGFSVVGKEIEIPIVVKFDEDDLKNSLRRERDRELEKCMLDSMRAFQEYDFREFREKNEAINEIIAERVVKETREYYRRSKIAEGTIISGGTLTLAAGAIEAYQRLQPLYQYLQPLLPILSPIIYKIISKMIEKREEAARWLVSRWPFQQRGLPFYLWLHGIRADRIKKALNA